MKKEFLKFIPFGLATLLTLAHIIQVLLTPDTVDKDGNTVTHQVINSVLFAVGGLTAVLILMFLKKPIWKYVFTLLAFLALTPFVSFYHRTFSLGIGIIQVELTALTILIFHLIVNPEVYNQIKLSFKSNETDERSPLEKYESQVRMFEAKFQNKSTGDLEKIVKNNSLVPEAIDAAKRVLSRAT